MGLLKPKEDNLRTSQPGYLKCRYAWGCDFSVVLSLTEIRFVTKQWLDISGGETGKRSGLWLVVVREGERLARLEEDPPCGRRTEDCVDEHLGCSEPGQSVEGRAAEEVS